MATAEISRYWTLLARRGCLLDGGVCEIAHAHGASIVVRMQEPKAKGSKLARYDWLVLPLCPPHHRTGSSHGRGRQAVALDLNPRAWEQRYGEQAYWIDLLCDEYALDLWRLAREGG